MEVEVKIRLPDKAAYEKVAAALSASRGETFDQENHFFDGSRRELNEKRVVLRVRVYDGGAKATLTLKGKQILENGIGRASEVEEDLDPRVAEECIQDPTKLVSASDLVKQAVEKFGVSSVMSLGSFKNVRTEFSWEGHTLELDETAFQHGTLYELECESDQPEELKAKLESFLSTQGIAYSYSGTSKFANFINKTLL